MTPNRNKNMTNVLRFCSLLTRFIRSFLNKVKIKTFKLMLTVLVYILDSGIACKIFKKPKTNKEASNVIIKTFSFLLRSN